MKKACIFDLDGTLVNSLDDLSNAMNIVLNKHHLPTHNLDTYQKFIGNGVKKLVERSLGEHQELYEECLSEFYRVYEEHCLDQTKPYPGIIELLEILKKNDVQLSVVTNKPHHLAIRIVEKCFPGIFVSIYGQQDLYPVKPHPQSAYLALMGMRCQKENCFFIGDSHVDIETGIQADMDTIGVTWGFRNENELKEAGASYIVNCPNEIVEIVCDDRS